MSLLEIYETWRNKKNYEKFAKQEQTESIILELLSKDKNVEIPLTSHLQHAERVSVNKKLISTWDISKVKNINFGDSLTDFTRTELNPYHDGIFSIAGSWAHHMEQMAEDLHPEISKFKIQNITIGCLGGNPMLLYQKMETIISISIKCLNRVRKLYPNARIIVYGLPPVYNFYVNKNCFLFDEDLRKWTEADSNAKFLSLRENFGSGFLRLFPTPNWSVDGVHFSSKGGRKFGKLLKDLMV